MPQGTTQEGELMKLNRLYIGLGGVGTMESVLEEVFSFFFFFKFTYFERERERARRRGSMAGAERKRESQESQAGSTVSVQSPLWGLNP